MPPRDDWLYPMAFSNGIDGCLCSEGQPGEAILMQGTRVVEWSIRFPFWMGMRPGSVMYSEV